jgi:hypothetical protein
MTQPDVYDVACLAGGPSRVVDTALVALVVTGRVRAVAPGELQVTDPRRRHPVEAAVLDAVGSRGRRSVATVRWRALADERVTGLARQLRARRLLGWFSRPTAAGRQVLERARAADVGPVLHAALEGPERLADPVLRAAVLEPPHRPAVAAGVSPWVLSWGDGCEVAQRTRDTLVARGLDGRP